jgi:hypothetical protein
MIIVLSIINNHHINDVLCFETTPDMPNQHVEVLLRQAVAEFLETPDGQEFKTDDRSINWSAIVYEIPDSIWNKYGLRFHQTQNSFDYLEFPQYEQL